MQTVPHLDNRDELDACPINMMMSLISAKWTVEILRELSIGPVRTRRFLRLIPGISMKCLQERLKVLKTAGMIDCIQEPQKVEYSITPRGRKLLAILVSLKELARELTVVNCECPMDSACNESSGDGGFETDKQINCPLRPSQEIKRRH